MSPLDKRFDAKPESLEPRFDAFDTSGIVPRFSVKGAGSKISKNVFKFKFTEALSSIPVLKAYDASTAFPITDSITSVSNDIFVGTVGNGLQPMLAAVDTCRVATPVTNWFAQAVYGVAVATCLLRGDDSYLQFRYSLASLTANASVTFNLQAKIPSDATTELNMRHDYVFGFTYTGPAPNITMYANSETAGGTEATPVWVAVVQNTYGIRLARADSTELDMRADIPPSGQKKTEKAWVTIT